MEDIEWEYLDEDSLARVTKLELNSKTVYTPSHTTTIRDDQTYSAVVGTNRRTPSINVAGEMLTKSTLDLIGKNIDTANDLAGRLIGKKSTSSRDINFIYPRIPKNYEVKNGEKKTYTSIPKIDELQISSLAHIQLQCSADAIIPPIPSAIRELDLFKDILSRTKNEMQTFKKEKQPMMGYIPNIDDRGLVIKMIEEYLKKPYECRIFGVDFSGSSNNPQLMFTVVSTLREKLKIRKNRGDNERYYLHVFNASVSKKSEKLISPVSDLLTHLYGVDSVSGVIWGGGGGNPDNARYIQISDYGAYRKDAIKGHVNCSCPVCSKYNVEQIYDHAHYLDRLKVHRMSSYREEYNRIAEKIRLGKDKAYSPYVKHKTQTLKDVERIIADVREIKARTGG
ncbi:MAG: hypothetical protein NT157_04555 [Candidatus Micrarchaeota archaeon]|nr:hypothetical protein [Candidatus Micrarchaeota archaeon]